MLKTYLVGETTTLFMKALWTALMPSPLIHSFYSFRVNGMTERSRHLPLTWAAARAYVQRLELHAATIIFVITSGFTRCGVLPDFDSTILSFGPQPGATTTALSLVTSNLSDSFSYWLWHMSISNSFMS